GHRFAFPDPVIGVAGHRADIVGQEHPSGPGRPFQYRGVIGPRKPLVLHADQINRRVAPANSPNDVVVEVLIRDETQHTASSLRRTAGEQAVPSAERTEASLVLLAGLVGLLPAALEISFHLGLVP